MKSTRIRKRNFFKAVKKWGVAYAIFVLPYCVVYLSGLPEWIGRIAAVSIFVGVLTPGIFWWSLNPKTEIVASEAKLARPSYRTTRKTVERILRIAGVLFGVIFFRFNTWPFMEDVYGLFRGESPIKINGQVADNDTYFGTWFLKQDIRLQKDKSSSYSLMYSLQPRINVGNNVEVLALPRSKVIVVCETVSPSHSQ